jgi:hypothetical protein
MRANKEKLTLKIVPSTHMRGTKRDKEVKIYAQNQTNN